MKQSLLRALPFTLALCLALAACGAPAAESDTSTPTSETAETPANPAAAAGDTSSPAIGAGEARLLTAEDLLASTPNYRPVTPWNEAAR